MLIFGYCLAETKTVPLQYKCFLFQAQTRYKGIRRPCTCCSESTTTAVRTPKLYGRLKNLGLLYNTSSVSFDFCLCHFTSSSRTSFSTSSSNRDQSLPHFRSTFWLAVEDFLTHPRLIHSDHKLQSTLFLSISAIPSDISNVTVTLPVCLKTRSRAHNILRLPVGLSANNCT